jgi:signal transduction histidine kinase/ActR/RegA family two-component response regulator/putative methionine-R-sulfoxide reductase with GAF domain
MDIYLVLEISILFQVAALVIAIWLIRVTGRKKAWVLLAAALTVMVVRRMYTLYSFTGSAAASGINVMEELIGLTASVLLAAGMAFTVPLIQSIKRSEELQIDINRSLRMFTLSNEAIITATDELTLLQYICRVIFEVGRYRLAWIGYREQNGGQQVKPVAHAGFMEIGREAMAIDAADSGRGICPVNTAIRTGKPAVCNNTIEDPAYETMRDEAEELGYHSMISLPLASDGQNFGVLNIYSDKPDSFTLSEVKLLQEMTDDLVYGIKALRAREEHKRIEAALARSEERVRASIENMPDAFSIYSAARDERGIIRDFQIDYVNAAACTICGMGADDLAEGRLLDILPDYRENGLFDEYCKVVETGFPLIIEKWSDNRSNFRGSSEEIRTYNIRAVKLEDGLVVAWRDISELERAAEALRASEARYLTIFNTASVPICVEDFSEVKRVLNELKSNGVSDLRQYMDEHPEFEQNALQKIRIQDVNEAAIKLYEAENKDELLATLESIYLPESSPIFREMLVAMMDEKEFYEGETVNRTLKGRTLQVWIRITIPGNDSEFENLLVGIFDLTERRKMEEELLKTQKLESLGVLAGGIAHDFNNMLTVILGNIVLAKMKLNKNEDVILRLDKAENAVNRAMELTRNLLTFSKGGELSIKIADIGELVRDASNFALSGAKSKCNFVIPADLWPVEVDSGQIRQVIENLVINADQSMPSGGTIAVKCENIPSGFKEMALLKDAGYIRISISDHGLGISPDIREKIFDPYFSTKNGKSGLGLATSYSIISKHGGQITVETTGNQGAVFCVYLPVADTQKTEKVFERKTSAGIKRVLVMDDEEEVREVAEGILKTIGCEITQAKDGSEAVELFLNASETGQPFDVVILDLTVSGGMGGKETIKKLLEIDKSVKAIVSTGYYNDPVMTEYRKFGFLGALNKPYKLQELSELLEAVICGEDV